MTVLQRNAANGVDLKKMGRTFATFALVGALGAGTVLTVTNLIGTDPAPTTADQSEFFTQANALNKADIGVASAPFLAGESAQTHTGRIGAAPAAAVIDRADLIFKQQAAQTGVSSSAPVEQARVVPSDRIADYPLGSQSQSSGTSQSGTLSHGGWSAR